MKIKIKPSKLGLYREKEKKFEILEESPDFKLKIFGSSPKDLFKNAIYSLGYTQKPEIVEQSTVGALLGRLRGKRVIEDFLIESMDYNTLLVDFLSEVLSRCETHNAVFFEVKFDSFSENKIEGRIYGVKSEDFAKTVKAVAYEQVNIIEAAPKNWETLLVFDI
ncbi:MAG: archease [Patescibacteria group bacterium]